MEEHAAPSLHRQPGGRLQSNIRSHTISPPDAGRRPHPPVRSGGRRARARSGDGRRAAGARAARRRRRRHRRGESRGGRRRRAAGHAHRPGPRPLPGSAARASRSARGTAAGRSAVHRTGRHRGGRGTGRRRPRPARRPPARAALGRARRRAAHECRGGRAGDGPAPAPWGRARAVPDDPRSPARSPGKAPRHPRRTGDRLSGRSPGHVTRPCGHGRRGHRQRSAARARGPRHPPPSGSRRTACHSGARPLRLRGRAGLAARGRA